MRAAVIGAGFLGSALATGAEHRGWDVTVIGHSDPYSLGRRLTTAGTLTFIPGSGAAELSAVLRRDVGVVVIAAGGRFPVPSADEPEADAVDTLSLLINVCEAVRTVSPDTRIVFLSSAGGVYAPGPGTGLRAETDRAVPTSPYGMSRLMAEHYLEFYRRVHGLSCTALRCSNVYGRLLPESRGQGVVSAAFRCALTGTPFRLHGTGAQRRDFLHVDDFVRAALDLVALGTDVPGTVNIGSGVGCSVVEVVERVSTVMARTIPVVAGPSAGTDTGSLVVDTSLLRSLVDFRPLPPDQGIELMGRGLRSDASLPR
ncbi:NAD-dependent epimerase/dehydratase family protein [Streptacidiphilus sp. P02-A3a]|uniref:NAD-dependent epimerase/dehydratase family protein n=1 Tax=Streptacidiphilus sp. P02-A3a TaxID=2704468 RepID=UPI0015FA605B|nr:NAD-dependent epimerase/dehydratase family protein [Streptacidiphilus sp. P02-A3a]QMU70546.1 NAD-dependent epimerase/dehydratase family protein [Streptacidiphilus sp. P02-A3a]